jgi:polyisoprenoid-binding protein YceI
MIAPPIGRHTLGPANATIHVKTYRQGVASRAGHDLVIEVTRWEATLSIDTDWSDAAIELTADPRSLEVREGLHGVKPLTDKDRAEIRKNIDEKVLRGAPIKFRSSRLEPLDDGSRVKVTGDLEMAGATRPIAFELGVAADGTLDATAALTQSAWGIKPYSALMGALKVRDELDVVSSARLPPG